MLGDTNVFSGEPASDVSTEKVHNPSPGILLLVAYLLRENPKPRVVNVKFEAPLHGVPAVAGNGCGS